MNWVPFNVEDGLPEVYDVLFLYFEKGGLSYYDKLMEEIYSIPEVWSYDIDDLVKDEVQDCVTGEVLDTILFWSYPILPETGSI